MRYGCQQHKSASAGAPFCRPQATPQYPPDLRVEPVHMRLDLAVDIDARTLRGRNTITCQVNGEGATELVLHAVDFASVVVRDAAYATDAAPSGVDTPRPTEAGPAFDWRYDGDTIAITWRAPLAGGARVVIAVDYEVRAPVTGLHFSAPSDALPDAPRFAVTDNETERARHWLPCIDLPSVRPTLAFAIRADASLTVLANGAEGAHTTHDDGTETVEWALEQRCPSYITCFAVGDFVRTEFPGFDGIPVAAFTTREFDADHLERSFGRTTDMLAWMTAKLGAAFPYPKYYQFAVPGIGGAMENISLVSWDDRFVLDEALASEWSRLVDQVNVHEMAHSYFGDLVVCRDFAHAWLKESWATYMEVCWFEDQLGADERDYELYGCAGAYFHEVDTQYARPIETRTFDSSWQMYDAHLYPGGAARLHMLRGLLGDGPFWAGVRDYIDRYAGDTVETDDFRRCLERASGRPLGLFFDQWFRGRGYPKLDISFEYNAQSGIGTFTVKQTQRDPDKQIGLFDFELRLGWGEATRLRVETVRVHEASHTFAFQMNAEPDAVRVDPGGGAVCRYAFNPGDTRLRAQLVDAPDVVGRIRAAAELALTGKRANIEAIGEAYGQEGFWGVRLEMVRELAHARSEAAIEVLEGVLRSESDPLVLERMFAAVAKLRDARLDAAIRARLAGDLPHRARKSAYEAVGAQRGPDAVDVLMPAAAEPGFGGIAQAGALVGLGTTRDERARRALIAASALGETPEKARPAACTALGIIGLAFADGSVERAEVAETLVERLRDVNPSVRIAAARGLRAMKATQAIDAIDRYARTLCHQERVTVERLAEQLSALAGKKPQGQADQIEALQGKVRKLEDALDALTARFEAHVGELPPTDADAPPEGEDSEDPAPATETTEEDA